MKLTIYRGTNEIGGNCIELEQGDTRILLDFGLPLKVLDNKELSTKDFKPDIKAKYNAVFLTHAHPDHYGLLELLDKDIPIYATAETCDILRNISPLTTSFCGDNLNLNVIESSLTIGEFTITPYEVVHSIGGACAYEIQCQNKTLVYTGDISFHGRCRYKNSSFKKNLHNVDYLIMEGTSLSRENQTVVTEDDLINRFVEVFKSPKLSIVDFSPINIDRFITVYKACLKIKKTLVIDPYTCYVLDCYGRNYKNIPQFDWNNIRVYFAPNGVSSKLAEQNRLYKYKSAKISMKEITDNPCRYVVKGNFIINKILLKSFSKSDLNIVYSRWKGYLEKPSQFEGYKDIITHIHTSGHAYLKDLQDFVEFVKPRYIIPIHTECKEKYKELFKSEIKILEDNATVEI